MDNFVPKKPGIQEYLFRDPEVTITGRNPPLYLKKKANPAVIQESEVNINAVYDPAQIAAIVRQFLAFAPSK